MPMTEDEKMDARERAEMRTDLPDVLFIEALARFGTVFQASLDPRETSKSVDYWQSVWNWMVVAHRDLLEDPDLDYPNWDGPDLAILNTIWKWQEIRMRRSK